MPFTPLSKDRRREIMFAFMREYQGKCDGFGWRPNIYGSHDLHVSLLRGRGTAIDDLPRQFEGVNVSYSLHRSPDEAATELDEAMAAHNRAANERKMQIIEDMISEHDQDGVIGWCMPTGSDDQMYVELTVLKDFDQALLPATFRGYEVRCKIGEIPTVA